MPEPISSDDSRVRAVFDELKTRAASPSDDEGADTDADPHRYGAGFSDLLSKFLSAFNDPQVLQLIALIGALFEGQRTTTAKATAPETTPEG